LICRFLIDGTIIFVNEAYCRYFNKTREELIGYSYYPAVPEEEQHLAFYNHLTLNVQKPVNTTEHRIIMPNGEVRWLQWSDRAILDRYNNIVEYQAVGRDITDSKNLEARLTYLSLHDALTGLYNRTYFDEEMKRLDNARSCPSASLSPMSTV
jgi:PAS domain S-box-containing protein